MYHRYTQRPYTYNDAVALAVPWDLDGHLTPAFAKYFDAQRRLRCTIVDDATIAADLDRGARGEPGS